MPNINEQSCHPLVLSHEQKNHRCGGHQQHDGDGGVIPTPVKHGQVGPEIGLACEFLIDHACFGQQASAIRPEQD